MKWAIFLVAAVAAAQPSAPASGPVLPGQRQGIDPGAEVELTIEDALLHLLRANRDVEASRLDVETARLNEQAARGVYDPSLNYDLHYENKATPVSSALGGAITGKLDETNLIAAPTLGGLLPWGATYQANTFFDRQTSTSLFVPLNPQYATGMTFYFEQPLLRGRSIDAARRGIAVSLRNRDLSAGQMRQKLTSAAAQMAKTYFNLLAAQENLAVQRNAWQEARRGVETNKRMVSQGLIPASDVATAESQAAGFEAAYYGALDQMSAAENALKQMLLPDRDAPLWRASLKLSSGPDTEPERIRAASASLDEAIAEALKNRAEMAELRAMAAIQDVNVRYYADQARPQVSVYANYTASGLAGIHANRPNPFAALAGPSAPTSVGAVPPRLLGGIGESYSNLIEQRFPTIKAGVKLSLPLRNRTAEANRDLAEIDRRRVRNQTAQLEQAIAAEVRTARQGLDSATARLAAASQARKFAQDDFESQQRRMAAGLTSVFELFQKQTRLVEAQARELYARTDLRNAVIEMERATGRTLDVYRIDIQEQSRLSGSRR